MFKDLLDEIKSIKYQITVKNVLSKQNKNEYIEFVHVYFNSFTKAVINADKHTLDKSFQEILYRIDNLINEGSGWIIESINGEYVNISVYRPLSCRPLS